MKKIISLIASVAMFCSLATSAFAFSGTASGATVDGATITVAEGQSFTFNYGADKTIKESSTISINVTNLINAGWTVTYKSDLSEIVVNSNKQPVTFSFPASGTGATLALGGKAMASFTATPGAGATIDGVTFDVKRTVLYSSGSPEINKTVTYTLAKAAAQEDKTTATITDGVVTFDYADADEAGAKLKGKKVVMDTANVAGTQISENTTVKVTYTADGASVTKTFGETLYETLTAEGAGSLEAKSIRFGVVCGTDMTGTFTFALN